jgi:hypothetical protein
VIYGGLVVAFIDLGDVLQLYFCHFLPAAPLFFLIRGRYFSGHHFGRLTTGFPVQVPEYDDNTVYHGGEKLSSPITGFFRSVLTQ